jgi:hypothetical protein
MANLSVASNSYREARRSTRRDQAFLVTVSGVDSCRGPYSERVSTLTISCHGCKYQSKYQVLPDALVTLELNPEKGDSPKISARGRVKSIQRDYDTGRPLYTAVEFEDPYNIWKIASPPDDWLPFCEEPKRKTESLPTKPLAVMRPELAPPIPEAKSAMATNPGEAMRIPPMSSGNRVVGQLMGEFQQQMEIMISEAAAAAVREKTTSILNDIHANLRDDAKSILIDVSTSQTGVWIEQSLKQMQHAGQERARALHFQWTKKIEADLGQFLQRIEVRQQEVEVLVETLFANSLERLQRVLESLQKDAVERIVARLKDRVAPTLRDASKIAGDLAKRKEDLERALADSSEKSSAKVEETFKRLEVEFEMVIRARLDAAQVELERVACGAASLANENICAASDRWQTESQERLREGLNRIAEAAQGSLEQKAAETSSEFAAELTHYSRSHLEFVSGAISELAKGIGKLSKE